MPTGLLRYQHTGHFHFVTFSCYQLRPLLADRLGYAVFEEALEEVRQRFQFVIVGYVLMPEHVHLLIGEPRSAPLSSALQALKQQTSARLKKPDDLRFWQRRYYDFNVLHHDKTVEKLKYIHRNPLRRGLVTKPEEWPWSSYRHYLTGERGTVEIETHWTAWKREHSNEGLGIPPFAKNREW
jgi:putative transposase